MLIIDGAPIRRGLGWTHAQARVAASDAGVVRQRVRAAREAMAR